MKKLLIFGLLVFLVGCTPAAKVCSVDSECVPVQCCHADEAVNKENAPDCKGILCTAECVPETLDCGQGSLQCVKGQCEVVLG